MFGDVHSFSFSVFIRLTSAFFFIFFVLLLAHVCVADLFVVRAKLVRDNGLDVGGELI